MDSMENMHTDVGVQRVNILLGASKTCELISFNLTFLGCCTLYSSVNDVKSS